MIGIGEQFEYIMRDESLHLAFACDLLRTAQIAERDDCAIGADDPESYRGQPSRVQAPGAGI